MKFFKEFYFLLPLLVDLHSTLLPIFYCPKDIHRPTHLFPNQYMFPNEFDPFFEFKEFN